MVLQDSKDPTRPRIDEAADRLYERVLVLRCQTGDEAAFTELVGRYDPRLRYYLRKMLENDADAQDALQEVWFDVFRAITRLNDPAALPAWLYRIAHDRAARQLRRHRRSRKLIEDLELPAAGEDDTGFSPEEARKIHAALDTLAPEHREVLVLRFMEEMSYEQIAAVTDSHLGTVRSRIHYAKHALRRAIERMD